jgi:hypothetical protein
MLAAGRRAIRVIQENVVMASGTDDTIDCFTELVVAGFGRVFSARLLAA